MEAHISKDILGHDVYNPAGFKRATGSEGKKKIKYGHFNKWMAYLLIANIQGVGFDKFYSPMAHS